MIASFRVRVVVEWKYSDIARPAIGIEEADWWWMDNLRRSGTLAAARRVLRSEARPGAGLEDVKGRTDVGCDRGTVATHHLPERAGDVRADDAGREDFLGEDDAVHQVCRA
jgi:hypothetical protein